MQYRHFFREKCAIIENEYKGGVSMNKITKEFLDEKQKEKIAGAEVSFRECLFENMDLTGYDLSNLDFTLSSFRKVILDQVDFSGASLENTLLDGCSMRGANYQNANLRTASMRECDMTGCNICGANLFCAVLEHARLDGVISDENTQWFRLHCPESGPFVAYKKCLNDRIVQLLVPADAKRTSATGKTCRCSSAKVLAIKNFDETISYEEAWSTVDDNFVYRKGEWVEVKDFNEDRWMDSTTGIHFWMNRDEAIAY